MRNALLAVALVCFAGVARGAPVKSSPTAKTVKTVKTVKSPAKPQAKKRAVKKRWKTAHSRGRFATPDDVTNSPAFRYGNLSSGQCLAELDVRKIPYARERTDGARGIDTPVRLTGRLHGVEFRTNLSDKQRATTPWELADCRLILALDDFSEILAAHDIVDVRHYSMHRLVPASWPDAKPTKQHMAGNAIDAARFIARDGTFLDVDKHWNGAIGAATCGDKAAPSPATLEATKLRGILCEAVEKRLFNVVLTPNYNRPHKNHFHLEVSEGVRWFLVH
jgi:hypothetical protein